MATLDEKKYPPATGKVNPTGLPQTGLRERVSGAATGIAKELSPSRIDEKRAASTLARKKMLQAEQERKKTLVDSQKKPDTSVAKRANDVAAKKPVESTLTGPFRETSFEDFARTRQGQDIGGKWTLGGMRESTTMGGQKVWHDQERIPNLDAVDKGRVVRDATDLRGVNAISTGDQPGRVVDQAYLNDMARRKVSGTLAGGREYTYFDSPGESAGMTPAQESKYQEEVASAERINAMGPVGSSGEGALAQYVGGLRDRKIAQRGSEQTAQLERDRLSQQGQTERSALTQQSQDRRAQATLDKPFTGDYPEHVVAQISSPVFNDDGSQALDINGHPLTQIDTAKANDLQRIMGMLKSNDPSMAAGVLQDFYQFKGLSDDQQREYLTSLKGANPDMYSVFSQLLRRDLGG